MAHRCLQQTTGRFVASAARALEDETHDDGLGKVHYPEPLSQYDVFLTRWADTPARMERTWEKATNGLDVDAVAGGSSAVSAQFLLPFSAGA